MIAQIKVTGNVSTVGKEALYALVFSESDEQLVSLQKKSFTIELLSYEEYIIAFFQKGCLPRIYSLNTYDELANFTTIAVTLPRGEPQDKDLFPFLRIDSQTGKLSASTFDLDKIKDKSVFATQMTKASNALRNFYHSGQLPDLQVFEKNATASETMRKSSHQIGQEIFKLLNDKRFQEKQLAAMRANRQNRTYEDLSPLEKVKQMEYDYTLLKKECDFYKTSYLLLQRELEKLKVDNNAALKKGQPADMGELRKLEKKVTEARHQYEIGSITLANKQMDWEETKLDYLESKQSASQQAANAEPELDRQDLQLRRRQENARLLCEKYNLQATDLVGRPRQEALAHAQKYVFEQNQVKRLIILNDIERLKVRDAGSGKLSRNIDEANRRLAKQDEYCFQSEMGYLEHIWHLRKGNTADIDFADDLYFRQSQLLALPQDQAITENEANTLADEEVLAKFMRIGEVKNPEGSTKTVKIQSDYYEIVIRNNGARTYTKNGKPITMLTYKFETVARFGEFLNNIRIEEQKRSSLLATFSRLMGF